MAYNPETRRKSYLRHKDKAIEYSTHYNRKRRTGITKDQYDDLITLQLGVCAICSQVCSRALAIDHNHITGQLRGLLCNKCNRGIGYLNDDVETVRKALEYLTKYSGSRAMGALAEYDHGSP